MFYTWLDIFGKEYSWTLAEIREMTVLQVNLYLQLIENRYTREQEANDKITKGAGNLR